MRDNVSSVLSAIYYADGRTAYNISKPEHDMVRFLMMGIYDEGRFVERISLPKSNFDLSAYRRKVARDPGYVHVETNEFFWCYYNGCCRELKLFLR